MRFSITTPAIASANFKVNPFTSYFFAKGKFVTLGNFLLNFS